MTSLPAGFIARAATFEDAAAAAEVIIANEIELTGQPDTDTDLVIKEWKSLGEHFGANILVVATEAGRLVAFEEISALHQDGTLHIDGFIHPEFRDRGIGSYLLAWADTRGRELALGTSDQLRISLRAGSYSQEVLGHKLLHDCGFRLVRHFYRMKIDLKEAPPEPVWPEGVTRQPFRVGEDEARFQATFHEAFLDHWGYSPISAEEWIETRLRTPDFDPTLQIMAVAGAEVAGIARCGYRLGKAWVHTLAVRRPYRGQGLGMALLRSAFGEFYQRGATEIYLSVDAASPTGATRLYERAGMGVVERYDLYEKVLREPFAPVS
jgi:GNAT superfamily N-acetyltransferase